jgi:hypothetical protein
VQLAMATKRAIQEAICLSGHIVDFTTHIKHLYTIPSIVGDMLESRERENTFILSYFLFLLLGAYYGSILCYFSLFLFIQFLPPPPPILPP